MVELKMTFVSVFEFINFPSILYEQNVTFSSQIKCFF